MSPGRLILGTHVNSGQMYRVCRNQAAASYSSLYFFISLSLQFSNIFFVTLFSRIVRPRILKLDIRMDSGQIYRVYQHRAAAAYSSSVFFLSHFQTLKFCIALFSGTVRPINLKLDTHVDTEWVYRVYCNQAASSYLSHISLFFLSLQCSKQNVLSHFSQEL